MEHKRSDRLTVTKLNNISKPYKQHYKSKLMTEKYSLLPINPQQLTPVQTALQRLSEKHPDFEIQPFQLVFLRDPPDLTSLTFPKIDTIPVNYHEYYNLLLARAQMIGRLLLEWRTQQALEYENKTKQ